MRIEVTAEDIKKGQPKVFFSCPIALAMSRATKKSIGVAWGCRPDEVGQSSNPPLHYLMAFVGKWSFYPFPMEVLTWVNEFDQKLPVKPFSFELNV